VRGEVLPAYYSEIDPFAAAWLRELIKAGHIAPGDVDERSIVEVRPDDLTGYTQVRLRVNKQGTSGAAASKLILRYKAAPFTQTVANYSDIGASEVSVATNVNGTFLETAWINLVAGAKADVFLALLGSGGDGALDPAFGQIAAEFK